MDKQSRFAFLGYGAAKQQSGARVPFDFPSKTKPTKKQHPKNEPLFAVNGLFGHKRQMPQYQVPKTYRKSPSCFCRWLLAHQIEPGLLATLASTQGPAEGVFNKIMFAIVETKHQGTSDVDCGLAIRAASALQMPRFRWALCTIVGNSWSPFTPMSHFPKRPTLTLSDRLGRGPFCGRGLL